MKNLLIAILIFACPFLVNAQDSTLTIPPDWGPVIDTNAPWLILGPRRIIDTSNRNMAGLSTGNPESSVRFKIQLATTTTDSRSVIDSLIAWRQRFGVNIQMEVFGPEKYVRIVTGNFLTLEEANKCKRKMWEQGFSDAFVTAYYEGKRITMGCIYPWMH